MKRGGEERCVVEGREIERGSERKTEKGKENRAIHTTEE